ncbi:MAG: DegQ family serine endoprotease [Nitrosomonas sp.]|nr:MAG: DegQ family serine endoprotease [Nitrosomonas sp.]
MFLYRNLMILFALFLFSLHLSAQGNGIESLRQTSKAFAEVARKVSPSVVLIQVERETEVVQTPFGFPFGDGERWPFGDDLFRRFFGDRFPEAPRFNTPGKKPGKQRSVVGQGSGFVLASSENTAEKKTYILTNNHVVEGNDKISVKFLDGREFEAKIKGTDPKSDIAVIEIDASGLPAVQIGDYSQLEVGEWVVAIGNPFGLSHTLTVGVVSAKGRTSLGINDYEDFIQTDAAINPGNSGGPLVNLDGEVVGMNTAIFSRSGGYMGIGFAIPINLAERIANQLIEKGEVVRGYLGIVMQPLTADLAKSFDLRSDKGILIAQVTKDSPADKAGLKAGDVIVSFQGRPVSDAGDFRNQVALAQPGSKVVFDIIRDSKQRAVSVKIDKLTDSKSAAQAPSRVSEKLGITVQTISADLARQFDISAGKGVVVTEVAPGSAAMMTGINPGSVILEVNRKMINTAAEFEQALGRSANNKVLLLVRDDDVSRYVVLGWR